MRKWLWAFLLALPFVAAGGWVYAASLQTAEPYICPLTGEELPCPRCCPLNN